MLDHARPAYPRDGDGRRVDVDLLLTLDASGSVTSVEVLGHVPAEAPESFDEAARAAARACRFAPARRDGEAIPVRVRYHMVIAPPVLSTSGTPPSGAGTGEEPTELGTGAEGIGHSHGTAPGANRAPPASDRTRAGGPNGEEPPPDDAAIRVRRDRAPEARGASDFYTPIGALRHVPRANSAQLLLTAPGILLTNEGGDGHAEQVFLRGFDAREGQDIEFTVNGIPVNEVGHPEGEGYADTHFVIPELVSAIRVLEGPFAPQQGNYAVAGSAEYRLGLAERGVAMQYQYGSFNTHRVMALWGPSDTRAGTFVGVDLRTSDGFGSNRASRLGRAMAQYEHAFSTTTTGRMLVTSYATQYGSAGVLRDDDFRAGRVDFFGTYDPTQGGSNMRHGVAIDVDDHRPERTLRQSLFFTFREFRSKHNFTGFLLDPPAPYRSGLTQRGDLLDMASTALTFGARGSARFRTPWRGETQAFEVGYYARHDRVDASRRRLRAATDVPYRIESDDNIAVTNVGVYADVEFHPLTWLLFRGGVRADYFAYDVLDRCAVHDTVLNAATPVVDELCYTRDRTGPRDPSSRASSGGLAVQPRGVLTVGPFHGLRFSAAGGLGSRAADPTYLGERNTAPFASIASAEAGVLFERRFANGAALSARGLYYFTRVDRDLVFNQQEGRNTLAPGTRRQGALVAARLTFPWLDATGSLTYADARFERDATDYGTTFVPPDAGDRVPYVPSLVARVEVSGNKPLPWQPTGQPITLRAAAGFSYVSPRALPYREWSDPITLLDASLGVRWRWFELGFSVQNVFDTRYRLGEYNYVSEFRGDTTAPDLIAARHFTAGAPRTMFVSLTVHLAQGAPARSDDASAEGQP